MKKHEIRLLTTVLTIGLVFCGGAAQSFAETEIDLSGDVQAAPTPMPSQKPSTNAPSQQSAAITASGSQEIELEGGNETTTQAAAEPTPTSAIPETHGVLKVKDVYEAGIKAYKEEDYDRAIRFLTQALKMERDPYTPKFIYAEANAMLGVIYQYHIIHYGRAYRYYKTALKYEPHNETARKHLKQVYKYRNKKD